MNHPVLTGFISTKDFQITVNKLENEIVVEHKPTTRVIKFQPEVFELAFQCTFDSLWKKFHIEKQKQGDFINGIKERNSNG
ncbi:MAG: hypothetical protein WC390_11840 [Sulfurimonas sp.]|jgi:hypothetical protein